MANEELGLRLTAQITEWLANLTKAGAAADGLKTTVLELEQAVKRAFVGIQAISRQSGGKMVAAFVGAAREMDKATDSIEADAKRTTAALGAVSKAAVATERAVTGAASGIAAGTKGIGRAADDASRNTAAGLVNVESAVGKVGERIKGSILNIQNALLGLGAIRFGQAAVGAASEFEASLGQLAIVANDTGVPISKLRQQILDLSKETPLALTDLTKAYATAVGSLPKGANQAKVAFEALNAAQQAARASGATTEETLRGITAILNTYGETGITAAQISDKLFATFDQGAATVPELANSIGQVAGIARGFGISIDEVFGSIAVLTRGGQSASEAITNLRQALISTANGGSMDKVRKQLDALGLSADLFSAESLRKNGLIGVLEQVEKAGGRPILNKLFTDTQGLLAVQTLLSKGLAQTRDDIARIGDAAGKTDQAVATISGNFDQLAGIARNRLGAAFIQIGERIMPSVIRVLNELADFAEKNGTQIADGVGRAVEALVRFGEWVVEYGPIVLKTFLAFKGISFFAGLAHDITAAVNALALFNKGFAASQALGQGMAALGGTAATSFDGGFAKGLKSLGGTLKAAFSSPGVLGVAAAAATIGYTFGTEMMEALGDAIEAGTQREIIAAIDDLDKQISGRLKALGARSVDEAAAIRRSIITGEAVQTAPGKVQTLAEVQAQGGAAATQAAFNNGLAAIASEVEKAQAGTAASVARMQEAAAKIEDLQRSKGSAAEIESAKVAFEQYQAVVQTNAKRVEDLTNGSKALVAQYTEVTQAAAGIADAQGKAGAETAASLKGTGRKLVDDSRDVVTALLNAYQDGYNKLRELQLRALQLSAEAAQNEADARRAAYDAETDARISALQDADVTERQLAELRSDRERGLVTILEEQIAAAKRVADARIEEARYAAERETETYRDNAAVQAQIAENLATEEATIQSDLAARTEEIRRASAARIAAAERAESQARAQAAIRAQEQLAQINLKNTAAGRVGGVVNALADPLGAAINAAERERRKGPSEASGDVLGELAREGGLIVGTLAGIGQAIAKLPDIFNGIAGFLTSGLDEFMASFYDSILNVLLSLATGLGPQIIKILTETLPSFVETLIASLPEIIGGLILLLPQIVFALVKAIAYSLPIAIYDGIVKAGEAIFDFLVSGMVQRIGDGIYDAFSAAGAALVDAIVAVFKPIIEFFKDIGEETGNFFSDLFGGGGNGAGAFIGRTVGTSALGKIATGNFGDLGVEDIPLIGGVAGLFHQGGTVDGGASNPHMAAALAMAGAQRFASGGMVAGLNSLARRRMSQLLSGDDVPILAAPGEGILTAQGVQAVGGPVGVESVNRGNVPGAATVGAQIVVSGRLGGDRALAALISRLVSVSVISPAGNVRAAMDQSGIATSVLAYSGLR